MKIRTDFVTNSSSSSFILKDTNMDDIYKAFEGKKAEILKDEWVSERNYEAYLDWLKYIKPVPIREHDLGALSEVLGWYEDDIVAKIFEKGLGAEFRIGADEYWRLKPETEAALEKYEFTDAMIEQLMSMIMVNCIEENHYHPFEKEGEGKHIDYATEETIQSYLVEMLSWDRRGSDMLYFVVSHYYEKVWELATKFANKPAGEIAEELFVALYGARYMYFNICETHYLISETIGASPICVLSCNHMG